MSGVEQVNATLAEQTEEVFDQVIDANVKGV